KLYKSGATGHTLERRTGASFTAAEAHQILETALNEVYCRPRGEYDSLKSNRDTFFITLNSQGKVDEDSLLHTMSEVAYIAGDFYYEFAVPVKEPLMFIIDLLDTV